MQQHALFSPHECSTPELLDAPISSVVLELQAQHDATLPTTTTGHQIHAIFHRLIARTDPALSTRLHNEPGYRPFTLSPLLGIPPNKDQIQISAGRAYHFRATLLDGGHLWHCLSVPLLEGGPVDVALGEAQFKLTRLLSTPTADGKVAKTTWRQLSSHSPAHEITLSFLSPTAFNINGNYFALFPEPQFVWDSLIRVWNTYAPKALHVEKLAIRDFLVRHVAVTTCALSTHTLHYTKYTQKGFCGQCIYAILENNERAAQITHLAAFAPFAGVGYKTTMGMGQVRAGLHLIDYSKYCFDADIHSHIRQ
jgi:CRISPR-associated endoribonuclease Cas6